MHYYQFNIGDYKSHTEHLSDMEDLTYRRLLDWYYLHETAVPLDEKEVARQIRMRSHTDCIAIVLREYFERTPDGWIHHRANKELAKAGDKSQKASDSAKARWDKQKNANASINHANALPAQFEGNATHNTEHITQDTVHKKKAAVVACPPLPDGLCVNAWQKWRDFRKAIKKPIKEPSIPSAMQALAKHGPNQMSVVEQSIANGWQGLFALKEDIAKQSKSTTFAERDAAAGRKRWEEMTGRKWPENETFIDAETFTLGIEHGTTD